MQNLQAYLMFNGNCEEAMNFYKEHLQVEILYLGRYKDSPLEVEEDEKDLIMHCSAKFWGGYFMASDNVASAHFTTEAAASNVHLSLGFEDKDVQTKTFEAMSEGGEIIMPLQETFWGDYFGQFKDKFGIYWMFSYAKSDENK